MFRNQSGSELNITDAVAAGWVNNTFWHWDYDEFANEYGFLDIHNDATPFYAWKGYFFRSNRDNITLMRQN